MVHGSELGEENLRGDKEQISALGSKRDQTSRLEHMGGYAPSNQEQ
jgi:hypothetical protein